mmetsp:Transcript_14912/g.23713  ORF Transcript_14912/g.23713 Transcript_14912/m.23713 type:complete len:107 (+) Transcript_14912:469-789(+)
MAKYLAPAHILLTLLQANSGSRAPGNEIHVKKPRQGELEKTPIISYERTPWLLRNDFSFAHTCVTHIKITLDMHKNICKTVVRYVSRERLVLLRVILMALCLCQPV